MIQPKRKQWKDLTSRQRALVVVGAAVQLTLMTLAQRDLSKRPADQVNGPKSFWRIVTMINFVGPIAYFFFGRKRQET